MTVDGAESTAERLAEAVDFLVGCVKSDRRWADWIAWQVESNGFRTAFQGWDLVPGNREIDWHEQAIRRARHTLLVVSPATFEARGALAGWDGLLLADPDGSRRLLIPVIVHACDLGPSLGGLTPILLAGLAEPEALAALRSGLNAILTGTGRPALPPAFPGGRTEPGPLFPGVTLTPELADLLSRVSDAYQQRYPGGRIARAVSDDGLCYLEIKAEKDGTNQQWPVGVLPGDLDDAALDRFIAQIHDAHARRVQFGESDLIYAGMLSDDLVRRRARHTGVIVQSIHALEQGWDPARYRARQAERLAADEEYPADLYVAQRYTIMARRYTGFGDPPDPAPRADVLGAVLGWLDTTDPRLILVLADFGHGKTFLTREIARQVPTLLPRVVPMVISLRMFEKSHTLDTVLAMHLQEAGEDGVPVRAVRRMLERGQLLLIFDGFDELAVRLTYDGAAEHLRMILSAVSGRAKVILTSRTQHFASNRQLLNALGEQVHLQPAARLVRLERFDDEQIQEFLRRSYARSTDPALAAAPQRAARDRFSLLNRISDLRGLAQTPRMLAFIADLPERDLLAARSADGRITQTDLYRTLVDRWLRFEAARKRPTAGALPSLDADQLRKAATAIALRRWTTDETGLDLPTLQTVVDEALPDIGKIELDAAQTLFAIGSGSLLTRDDNDRFGFVHSSVMEYLVAAAMTKELAETGDSLLLDSRQTSALIIDFLVGTRTAHADLERWARGRLKAVDGRRPTGLWRRRRAPVGSGPGRLNALALASRLGLAGLAPDLSMQDLRGVDLTSRDLRYANLMGADLRGVQLADLDLTGADLRGADLTGTRLTRPKLRGARLENSDWHRAALLAPDLDPADLDADALSPAAIPGRDAAQPMWLPYLLGEPTLAWDGRGELLAAAWGNHVLLTTAELVPLRVLRGQGDVTALALASDGRTLAIGGSDGAVLLADLDAGPRVRQLTGHPATVRALAFAPDGQIMASADRTGYIWHWAVTSGRGVRRSEAGFDVVSMAFARDGQTLAAGGNGVIAQHLENPMLHLDDLTQSTSATRILPPTSSANQLNCLALATAGDTVAVGCRDGTILLLSDFAVHGDATSVHDPGTQVLRSHTSAVLAVAFDGDELISVDVGNLCRSKGTKVSLVHTSPYSYIPSVGIVATLAPSGGLVCRAGRDGAAEVWDPPAGQITGLLTGGTTAVHTLAFSPDGRSLVSAARRGLPRLWEVATGRQTCAIHTNFGEVAVAFSPDSRLLGVSGTRGSAQVQLFEVVSGRPLAPIATGEDARALAFSSDGQDLVMVLRSGSVAIVPELIRPATHSEITKVIFSVDPEGTPQNLLTAVAFTPERNIVTLSVPGDISIRLMRLTLIPPETDSVWYGPLEEISEDICVSTISPNGKMAAFTGPLESLRLYDVAAGRLQHSLPGFRGVTSLSFSWNGRVLASGHGDEKARLWDVATGREIHAFSGYGPVTAVAVTPAGQTVATGHDDGAVRLWDVPSGRMIATLLALSGDNWATLLPDDSFTLAQPTTELWWAVKLCRFSADEIADLDPGVRRRDPSTPIPR